MRAGIAVAVAVAGLVMNGAALADGNALLIQCKIVLHADPNVESTHALQAGLCLGLVQGVRQTMKIYADLLPKQVRACIPDGMTNGQGTKVVVKYLEEHPKDLHLAETPLTMAAYRDAYPCRD